MINRLMDVVRPKSRLAQILSLTAVCACCAVLLFWFLLPTIIAGGLNTWLGTRPYRDVLKAAEQAHRSGLAGLNEPRLLLDIPAYSFLPPLQLALQEQISKIESHDDWSFVVMGPPEVATALHVVRLTAALRIKHAKWGMANVRLVIDGLPQVGTSDIAIATAITAASVDDVAVQGLRLPWPIVAAMSKFLAQSLDALNTRMPTIRVPFSIPPGVQSAAGSQIAVLVSGQSISILMGPRQQLVARPAKPYEEDYIGVARKILPTYNPGQGVIAVRKAPDDNLIKDLGPYRSGGPDTLAAESISVNLSAVEALLNLAQNQSPGSITASTVSRVAMATGSAGWVSARLKASLLSAIDRMDKRKVQLVVDPGTMNVSILEGVAELSTAAEALLLDGAVKIKFVVVVMAAVFPAQGGLEANYAVKSLKISSISWDWKNNRSHLSVPYEDELGQLIVALAGTLPKSLIEIPPLPIHVPTPSSDVFKVTLGSTDIELNLLGRAVLLSPDRVTVLTIPSLSGTPLPQITRSIANADYARMKEIFSRVAALATGDNAVKDEIALVVGRAGVAQLLDQAWSKLAIRVSAAKRDEQAFAPTRIDLIKPDATCANPCREVSSCGKLQTCTDNFCTFISASVCQGACPPRIPFEPVSGEIRNRCLSACQDRLSCNDQAKNSCVNAFHGCTSSVETCVGSWASGQKSLCDAALAAIDVTNFRGLAEISGVGSLAVEGDVFSNSKMDFEPDLSRAKVVLQTSVVARLTTRIDVKYIQIGRFLRCPDGPLVGDFLVRAPPQGVTLNPTLTWTTQGSQPGASLDLGKVAIQLEASEPPIQSFVKQNAETLLKCSAGQVVVGLSLLTAPHITQDLLGKALRKSENGKIGAAVVDGKYTYEGKLPVLALKLPNISFVVDDKPVVLHPVLSPVALMWRAASAR